MRSWILVFLLTQAAAPQTGRVIGEVQKVDAGVREIILKTGAGASVRASLEERTLFLRVPPGEKDLSKAQKIQLGDVQPGDRVLARGRLSEDQQSIAAASIIVMSKSDLAQRAENERAEWQRRGIAGVATSVSGAEIAVRERGGAAAVIETTPQTRFRRYAPGSVRFSDAKPGEIADIKTGDQVRVLGDPAGEGRYKAEVVVSGSFRTIAGTVTAVDPDSNTVRITDLSSRRPVAVVLNQDSTLRRIPAEMAERMARFMPGAGAPQQGSGRGPGGGAPGGRGGPPDLGQMLERMPAMKLDALKPGEAVIVSSTAEPDPSRATAIALIAGVEPFLRSGSSQSLGGWNFEIGLP